MTSISGAGRERHGAGLDRSTPRSATALQPPPCGAVRADRLPLGRGEPQHGSQGAHVDRPRRRGHAAARRAGRPATPVRRRTTAWAATTPAPASVTRRRPPVLAQREAQAGVVQQAVERVEHRAHAPAAVRRPRSLRRGAARPRPSTEDPSAANVAVDGMHGLTVAEGRPGPHEFTAASAAVHRRSVHRPHRRLSSLLVVIEAAGGLVWRTTTAGEDRGPVDPPARARRLVAAEGQAPAARDGRALCAARGPRGDRSALHRSAPSCPRRSYKDRKGRSKHVRFWSMQRGSGSFRPNREVDEVRWVPIDELDGLLTEHELLGRRRFRAPAHRRRLSVSRRRRSRHVGQLMSCVRRPRPRAGTAARARGRCAGRPLRRPPVGAPWSLAVASCRLCRAQRVLGHRRRRAASTRWAAAPSAGVVIARGSASSPSSAGRSSSWPSPSPPWWPPAIAGRRQPLAAPGGVARRGAADRLRRPADGRRPPRPDRAGRPRHGADRHAIMWHALLWDPWTAAVGRRPVRRAVVDPRRVRRAAAPRGRPTASRRGVRRPTTV